MKSKIIVFDFDKTLSYSDTLFGFFSSASKKNIAHPFKIVIYLFTMVLTKFKVLSNTDLKHIGIILFLKGMNQTQLQSTAINYSKKIQLNRLYREFDFFSKNIIYIVSASFTNYLRPLFPENVKVLGSEILFKKDKITGLSFNCFESNKAKILINKGVTEIDLLYTDSYSDFSLACMAKKIIIIHGDKSYECRNIESFKSYFDKN
jgi:phosphoserine phosphatase